MAANEIAVCRMALGMLGIGGQSSTMTSASDVADLAASSSEADAQITIFYATARDTILRAPWGDFALGVELTQDDTSAAQSWALQWQYTYEYPDDCLAVLGMLDRGRLAPRIKFRVGLNDDGDKVVFCDQPTVLHALIVTESAQDVTLWTPAMDTAVAAYLASLLAMPLRADPLLARERLAFAQTYVDQAWASSGIEVEPDGNQYSRYEMARWGYPNVDG